jgi:hypothetical protein
MATKKKPAKPIAGQSKETTKTMAGKAVLYFSPSPSAPEFKCETCSRTLSKGIVYEDNNKTYCKRSCIPKVAA